MNVQTLKAQSRLKTPSTTTNFSDANLLVQLNEGYYTLASIVATINEDYFEEQRDKFNLIANSGLYSLPTDTMKVKQVRLAYSTPSVDTDYKIAGTYDPAQVRNIQNEENVSTANPIVDITNNYFRIKPKPTTAVTNGGMLYYISRPSALVNSADVPIIPQQFQDLIAIYGAKQMALSFEMTNRYQLLQGEWLNGIERMKKELAARNANDTDARMRSPLEDGVNRVTTELW